MDFDGVNVYRPQAVGSGWRRAAISGSPTVRAAAIRRAGEAAVLHLPLRRRLPTIASSPSLATFPPIRGEADCLTATRITAAPDARRPSATGAVGPCRPVGAVNRQVMAGNGRLSRAYSSRRITRLCVVGPGVGAEVPSWVLGEVGSSAAPCQCRAVGCVKSRVPGEGG